MDRKKELKFGERMDTSPDKKEVANLVINYHRKNVLDLGAGTGIISKLISETGINCVAVDNNFKLDKLTSTNNLIYVSEDLTTFIQKQIKNQTKYDCIILSAVLHELNKKEFKFLEENLSKIMTNDCVVIIREPFYRKHKKSNCYWPFVSLKKQKIAIKEILTVTAPQFQKWFNEIKKTSEQKVPYPIKILNMAFTYSYGEDSWEREIHEYRYAFSYKKLMNFIQKIYNGNFSTILKDSFNECYIDYFRKCGYSDDVIKSIYYTNFTLIAKRG